LKSKVLVTGGAGFVGSHLVSRLLNEGRDVVVLDDLSTGSQDNLHKDALFIEGDIRDNVALVEAVRGCSVIYHLAARVELQQSIDDPTDCFSVNVAGTARVLMEALKIPDCRLLFASSCAVYPLNPDRPLSEGMATQGETPYAMSKVLGENMMEFYSCEKRLNYCALRCFNIYGPGQRDNSSYAAVIPKFIKFAKQGKPLKLYGGGQQTRDFIHVDDVVEAYILMSALPQVGVFNVGTGKETSIRELAEIMINLHENTRIEISPAKLADAKASCANIQKIKSVCGFDPSRTIQDGLRSLCNN